MGLYFISLLVLILCVLLSVAFFTLLERKVLGYIQLRKGPNKVGLGGLPQPLADALKLFIKEYPSPSDINYFLFLFAPLLSLFLSLMLWILYPLKYALLIFFLGLIFFLCVSSLNVYSTLLAGWASNSKYALLGALRAIAQTISYEVSMALFLLSIIFMFHTFDLNEINLSQFMINILFMPLLLCWIVTNLAETNRAPFDFAEGESEIVSGFNVEYSSGGFAMLFMAEYGSIMLMCFLTTALFFGMFLMVNYFMMILIMVFFNICFLWVRGSFPRFRYDQLMMLTWKNLLPYSLSLLMMIMVLDWVLSSSLILSYFK